MATDPRQLSINVNIVVALASLLRPDLVAQFPPDQVRQVAADVLLTDEREREGHDVPAVFRDAFAE